GCAARHVFVPRAGRCGWVDELRIESCRHVPPDGHLCRQGSQGRKPGRDASVAAHQIRDGDQSENRQGDWSETLRQFAVARRRGDRMKRREFITLIAGAAAWPLTARAQQADKLPTIGFLGTAAPSAWAPWTAAFVQRLHELGWIEGRRVAIPSRWAAG